MAVRHAHTGEYWYAEPVGDEASTIHQFRIGKAAQETAYVASGIVPGRVLNQFSMDEHDGRLRIATTSGHLPSPDVRSTLTVLERVSSELKVTGQLDNIAPTEDIRSVRFDGDRGYLVTFKKTDPLFVLDLATPEKPKVLGELKIPGFSTYMHRIDRDHLLAIGYEADDQGDFAYFNGIQIQLFDVSKPTEPTLLHKQVYGTRGSSSEALTDHLAFTYLKDSGVLTLPMTVCDGGGQGSYGTLSFSGVAVLDVGVQTGIHERGRFAEPLATPSQACSDWWTASSSAVKRTVVLDEFVYAISDDHVRIQSLDDLGADVNVVEL
jgi:hypothetical protein